MKLIQQDVILWPNGQPAPEPELCRVCGEPVKVMIYRGSGACGELHDKVNKGQLTIEQVAAITAGLLREDGIK